MNKSMIRTLRCWFRLLRQCAVEKDYYMYNAYEHKLLGAGKIMYYMHVWNDSQYDKFKNAVLSNYRNYHK